MSAIIIAFAGNAYDDGVAARLDGRFEAAATHFEAGLAEDPLNSDLHVQYGLTLSALGRYDDAEAAFRTALELAPDYEDARLGLARLAWYQGNLDEARAWLTDVSDTDAKRDLLARIEAAEAAPDTSLRWHAGFTYEHSMLTEDLPDWSDLMLHGVRRLDNGGAVTAQLQHVERFETEDIYAQLQYSRPFGEASVLRLGAGGAADADFRPEWTVMAGLETRLIAGSDTTPSVGLTADLVRSRFVSGDVSTLKAGPWLQSSDGQYRVGLEGILLEDETGDLQTGVAGSGQIRLSPDLILLGNIASAPETAEGFTVDVETLAAGVRWSVSQEFTLSATLVTEDRGAYDRRAVAVSLDRRF